jgi:NTE family protein
MKKLLSILLLVSCSIGLVAGQTEQRKKVGVVLSGGSAKGFAHVGVLKVLEEAGIPIDYIAGTSMGAVVGGLYAVGYSAEMIDSLINLQDWNYLMRDHVSRENLPATRRDNGKRYLVSLPYRLRIKERSGRVSLPPGVYAGQNIYSLFLNMTTGYQHEMDFDDLPIPFACVAGDVRSGKEVVFREGVLPTAMRASMAIPGVFTPVEIDSMLLIDGGIINNYPVDVVREMGADIVIGVIFPPDEKAIEKGQGSITEVTEQLWNFIGNHKRTRNIKDTDLLITPGLHPYGSMDFQQQAIDSIISRGAKAAMDQWDKLIALKKSLGIEDEPAKEKKTINPYIDVDTLLINNIRVEGISSREEKQVLNWISFQGDKVTRKQLDAMTARVYGSGLFSRVYYRLDGEQPFDLIFSVEPKQANTLNLGVHFDSKDMAAILANTTIRLNRSLHSMFDITTRLSRDPYLTVDYSINSGLFYKGGVNYTIGRNDLHVYNRGSLAYNAQVTRNALNLNFSGFYFGNIRLHLGTGFENFHFANPLQSISNPNTTEVEDQFYINHTFNGIYDDLNDTYFPSSGGFFSFQYSMHTDNFVQLNNDVPLSVLKMNAYRPIRLADKVYVTPRVAARYVMNNHAPNIYRNFVGGRIDGHYLPQQIALQGSTGMEILGNMVLSTDAGIHYNFTPNNYLYGNINFTAHHNRLHSLFNGKSFLGGNIGYSYLTIVGPLRAELGYSGLSKRLHPYVSIGYYF